MMSKMRCLIVAAAKTVADIGKTALMKSSGNLDAALGSKDIAILFDMAKYWLYSPTISLRVNSCLQLGVLRREYGVRSLGVWGQVFDL